MMQTGAGGMMRRVAACLGVCACVLAQAQPQHAPSYRTGPDGLPLQLTETAGDAARGRAIVANRQLGLCLLCHTAPIPEERFQGNLAPDIGGAGERWSEGALRLRMIDAGRFNAATIMPAYYRADGLNRVPAALQGKTILTAQQVEDVVAYLLTLRTAR
jgi:sulfur-oxidizing protein SoxX